MKVSTFAIILILFFITPSSALPQSPHEHVIYDGRELTVGYKIGVDTSEKERSWLTDVGTELVMNYPDGQKWGAVFITVGEASKSVEDRRIKNFSHFETLIISMKGATGEEQIEIGIKDKSDPNDGSETKTRVSLTREYSEYRFPLTDFRTADLQNLHVVTEFVFPENSPCMVYVNSVRFQ